MRTSAQNRIEKRIASSGYLSFSFTRIGFYKKHDIKKIEILYSFRKRLAITVELKSDWKRQPVKVLNFISVGE